MTTHILFNMDGILQSRERVYTEVALTADEINDKLRTQLMTNSPAQPHRGVKRLIQHLKEHNVPIGVATPMPRKEFEEKSRNNKEFFKQFDNITCGDDSNIKHDKPVPDIFLAAAESLGAKVSKSTGNHNILVFEDTVLGAWAGVFAGMRVILVPDLSL
ncbi:Pseudouridine-5'-phosphatase, partial [Rhizoclosmatium sp. JEL0117]